MKRDGVAEIKIAISQEVPRLNFPLVVEKPLHGSWMKDHYVFGVGLRDFFFDTQKPLVTNRGSFFFVFFLGGFRTFGSYDLQTGMFCGLRLRLLNENISGRTCNNGKKN